MELREQIQTICDIAADGRCNESDIGGCPFPNEDDKCGLCFTLQILKLIEDAGWIDPSKCIMPGEFGTPKAEEILTQWAEANGYLPVEPVELEVMDDKAIRSEWGKSWLKQDTQADLDDETMEVLRDIVQAIIAKNQKEQLYRLKK